MTLLVRSEAGGAVATAMASWQPQRPLCGWPLPLGQLPGPAPHRPRHGPPDPVRHDARRSEDHQLPRGGNDLRVQSPAVRSPAEAGQPRRCRCRQEADRGRRARRDPPAVPRPWSWVLPGCHLGAM